jgi:hypothetical protein
MIPSDKEKEAHVLEYINHKKGIEKLGNQIDKKDELIENSRNNEGLKNNRNRIISQTNII